MRSRRGRHCSSVAQDSFVMWRRRCSKFQHQTLFRRQGLSSSHKGKAGQSGSQERLLSCQLGRQGNVAWRVILLCPVQVNPCFCQLPLPSLSPTCHTQKLGPGAGAVCPFNWKRPQRRVGRAPQRRQRG